jgi:hypothetical protein
MARPAQTPSGTIATKPTELERLDAAIYAKTMDDLKRLWSGRLPTWQEFKQAEDAGRVKTNKTIAQKALCSLPGIPKGWYILYGVITPWAMFIIPITGIILYFVGYANVWVMVTCILGGWYLYKMIFIGACYGIMDAAKGDERIYETLLINGAFVFGPS